MRGVGKEAVRIAAKRKELAGIAYGLFCEKGIENVTLQEIADKSGCGVASIYRYFNNKQTLVVEAATCKWEEFLDEISERRFGSDVNLKAMTAAQVFDYYLDTFIELYRNHKDLLAFNQYFNVYIRAEQIGTEDLKPYRLLIESLKHRFSFIYEKGRRDHTLRVDIPEDEIFSVTLHLMLAAVTRYAVGLAYMPEGFEAEKELNMQKEALKYLYIPDYEGI